MSDISIFKSSNEEIEVHDDLLSSLGLSKKDIEIETIDRSRATAVVEWAIPAGIVVIIAKPFFDAVMKKLGDATGEYLVEAFKNQYKNANSARETVYTAKDLRAQTNNNFQKANENHQANDIGKRLTPLEIRVKARHYSHHELGQLHLKYRFIFPPELSMPAVENAFQSMAVNVEDPHSEVIADYIQLLVAANARGLDGVILIDVIYDEARESWISLPRFRREQRES